MSALASFKRQAKAGATITMLQSNYVNKFLNKRRIIKSVHSWGINIDGSRLDYPRASEISEPEPGLFEIQFDPGKSYEIKFLYFVEAANEV